MLNQERRKCSWSCNGESRNSWAGHTLYWNRMWHVRKWKTREKLSMRKHRESCRCILALYLTRISSNLQETYGSQQFQGARALTRRLIFYDPDYAAFSTWRCSREIERDNERWVLYPTPETILADLYRRQKKSRAEKSKETPKSKNQRKELLAYAFVSHHFSSCFK